MNSTSFIVFAVVYAAIALAVMSAPAVAGFFTFCAGASVIKAFRVPATKPVHRSPFGYAH